MLAYLIAGHHAGLSDWNSEISSLEYRLAQEDSLRELEESLAADPPQEILDSKGFAPNLRAIPGGPVQEKRIGLGFALWVRMLFSCLVDADFLDAETYMDPGRAEQRRRWPGIAQLLDLFDRHMAAFSAAAKVTPVNRLRAEILVQCRAASRTMQWKWMTQACCQACP